MQTCNHRDNPVETRPETLTLPQEWERHFENLDGEALPQDLLRMPQNRFLTPLVKPGLRILEAGSGNGRYVFAFALAGALEAVGIDFSDRLIEKMSTRAKQLGFKNVTGVTGDILKLPFPDASFDLYTSFGVYEHFVPSQHQVLFQEAWRVLKPGGLLYLEVPHRWSAWTVRREFRYWFRKFGSEPLVWQRNLSRGYLVRCGARAGFQVHTSRVFDAAYGFEKGFTLTQQKHLGLPNPFYYLRPLFYAAAKWCEEREWLGHTLVYIGRKPHPNKAANTLGKEYHGLVR